MGTIELLRKMFYIMDTSENYYQLDKSGQLVVADGKEDAVFFTYEEADKKIGKGKRAHYYKIVPTGMYPVASPVLDQLADNIPVQEDNRSGHPELADLSRVDWLLYLQNFSYIMANIHDYKEQLCTAESEQDQTIIDLLYFIEFYDLDESQEHEILIKVKMARKQRRDIKNELYRIGQFTSSIGTNNNVCIVNSAIRSIQHYEASKYKPRVLTDLFQGAPEETHREISCYHSMAARYEVPHANDDYKQFGMEEETDMERRETIYDAARTDWKAFVKSQADFFRYAQQYIQNLEIDLVDIDTLIEKTLSACEDAKYNVAQGYTVFKKLKELRNERKELLTELQRVTAITDRFDCDVMREIYDEIETEYAASTSSADEPKPISEAG